jgi:uracil phosphoribosyltransferase
VKGVTVVTHPVMAHRVGVLRDKRTDRDAFRMLVSEISRFLAYEGLRDLGTSEVVIDTPVADGVPARRVSEHVLVVPVLRAGLGMVQAIQEVLPLAEVAHVGLRRDEVTLQSNVYLNRLPADLSGRRVVVCDPMLATGGSLIQVCDLVLARGARAVVALCIIASEPGLVNFTTAHPSVPVFCAAVDPVLNEVGYIVPGLGDAGDRLFGPPD